MLFLLVAFLGYLVLKPVLIPLLLSFIIAYFSYPLYKIICKYIKHEGWSAFIVAVLLLIIIMLPIIFVMNALVSQTQVAYTLARRVIVTGDIFQGHCTNGSNFMCETIKPITELFKDPKVKFYLEDGLKSMTSTIIDKVTGFIFAIPKRVLDFFIMLFTIFYLLKDGPKFFRKIKAILPMNKKTSSFLISRMKSVFHAMIYGYFLIAIIQGILGGIGFFAVGLPSPVLWGAVMAVVSLLPIFGTALVWVPASLLLITNGLINNDTITLWKGIALFIYGIVVVSMVDNLLRPKIVSQRADIHPVVVLIGVVGGMQVFGFMGLIIGPIILIILITLFGIFENINKKNQQEG